MLRRSPWTRSSKRFIATWRKTAATAPSSDSASSDSRAVASGALEQPLEHDRLAEDRRGLGDGERVANSKIPFGRASAACTPWPSSWAMISTSIGSDVWLSITYGCADGTA